MKITGSFKFLFVYFSMEELKYDKFYISWFQIRRVRLDGERWYSITDVIAFLTKSKNPMMYTQLIIKRKGLEVVMKSNIRKFLFQTDKWKRIIKCSNLCWLWYITHVMPKKYRWRVKVLRKRVKIMINRYKNFD